MCCYKNNGLLNGGQLQADPDPRDHEDSYSYFLQVSFFEEHMHHVSMERTTGSSLYNFSYTCMCQIIQERGC